MDAVSAGSPYETPIFLQRTSKISPVAAKKALIDRQSGKKYVFGPFVLDPAEQTLLKDGEPLQITPKSFDLLAALVQDRGHLITKEELLERVWPNSFVEEANLSVKMSELRRVLGEAPNEKQYIETVPRRGYRFVADVSVDDSRDGKGESLVAADEAASNSKVAPRSERPRWRFTKVQVGLTLAATLAVIGLIVWLNRSSFFGPVQATEIHSLAVLPMANLSGDPAQDYFADGMTDALISGLARVGALRVISRTSVMQYKDAQKQLPEIGRELDVDAVIEGSVQRFGDRVKISVQLLDAKSDRHVWSETYDRKISDILLLQNEIARSVTQAVRVKLTPQEETRFGNARQIDAEAYDYFLRGRYYSDRQTKADNENAIEMFEQAVAADPNFAAAHAALAQACVWRFFLFTPEEKQWEEMAFVSVEKALSLDPDLAEAHLARGRLLWTPSNHFPHDKAIEEYRRALELNPNLDEARNQLAVVYSHVGLLDEALAESEKAVSINPSNTVARYRIGETLLFKGEYERALQAFRSVPKEANPALIGHQSAWALFNLGRTDEAAATLEQFLKDYPDDTGGVYTSVQAVLAASAGKRAEAEEKIKLALEKGKGFGAFHHTAYQIACAYAIMNETAQAIEWLRRAADNGFPCFPMFEREKSLDNVRNDPRFVSLMADLKNRFEQYRSAALPPP
jgi:TolB-like protein/DNA-binding winged helix-turn-helix (wHTH) protein/Tfp pilus assembly protein PilF